MKRLNRNQAFDAIKRREPFKSHTGSFWAQFEGGHYTVYSYSTPIASCSPHGVWVLSQYKYSSTTSRHQGIIRRAIS